MKRFFLTTFLWLCATPVLAQNPTCPTRPLGDNSNACASTAFVHNNAISYCAPTNNGTTDDDTATIQACIDLVETGGASGTIFLPTGGFCLKTGPLVMHSVGTILEGNATYGTTLDACGTNSAMIKMDNVRQVVRRMTIHGSQSFLANKINIEGTVNCGQCLVEDVVAYEGSTIYDMSGADALARNVTFYQAYSMNMVAARQVQWFERAQLDHNYEASATPPLAAPGAWAATTAYSSGAIVSDAGYYLQATIGGTSGGSLPTLLPYNTNITDGTVTWRLLGPTAYCNINVINAPEVHMHHSDVTGYASSGICLTGTTSFFKYTDGVFASALFSSVDASGSGNGLFITNVDSGGCIVSGCATVRVAPTFAGNTQINNLRIFGVSGFGINYQGGANHLLTNSIISSPSNAVLVDANVNDFSIVNNVLFGTISGVTVTAGTSTRYTIAHNRTNGSGTPVVDGGTGTTKLVIDNDAAVAGLTVLGVTGSANGPYAAITAPGADRVLRVNSAGNALSFGAVNLASTNAVTGTLPVGNGGTGLASGVSGGVLAFSGTTTIVSSPVLTAFCLVYGGGAGAAPAVATSTCPTSSGAGVLTVNNTTASTSTATGSLINAGGFGNAGRTSTTNLSVGTISSNSWGTTSTFTQVGLYIAGTLTASGGTASYWQMDATIAAAANNDVLSVFRVTENWNRGAFTGTQTNVIYSAPLSGTVDYVINANANGGKILISDTTSSTTTTTGSGVFSGGLGIGENITAAGTIKTTSTTNATSTTTGALQVAGGMSMNKRLFMDGLSADTGMTDNSVCHNTTTHEIVTGTGAAGICLGTSSARYKRDIIPAHVGLAEVLRLRPVNFYYLPGRGGPQLQYGFLAEDVVDVIPSIVGLDRDAEPNTVDMMAMVPILVKSIQELKGEMDNLSISVKSSNGRRGTRASLGSPRP